MATSRRIPLGYNNVYLLAYGEVRVLVDAGPDYAGATDLILSSLGGTPPDLVVATHGHLDHAGLGAWWQAQRVPVGMGEADQHLAGTTQLASQREFDRFGAYVRQLGAPDEVVTEIIDGLARRREWAREAAKDQPHPPGGEGRWPTQLRYRHFQPDLALGDGAIIGGTSLEVVLCPGHTPGNLVLFDASEGWLFSGDQLLPDITPTPAIQASPAATLAGEWRFPSLPRFLDSMLRIRRLNPIECWPGHGEPFKGVVSMIDENIGQIEQRTARVLEVLKRRGEAPIYDLAADLYPRALRRRFWQIVATVQGHLDLLEERGLATTASGLYAPVS